MTIDYMVQHPHASLMAGLEFQTITIAGVQHNPGAVIINGVEHGSYTFDSNQVYMHLSPYSKVDQ